MFAIAQMAAKTILDGVAVGGGFLGGVVFVARGAGEGGILGYLMAAAT